MDDAEAEVEGSDLNGVPSRCTNTSPMAGSVHNPKAEAGAVVVGCASIYKNKQYYYIWMHTQLQHTRDSTCCV